jgi:hypothetical protein
VDGIGLDDPGLAIDPAIPLPETRIAVGQAVRAVRIAHLHGQHVVAGEVDGRRGVEDEPGIAAAMLAEAHPVHEHVSHLEHALEVDVHAGAGRGGQGEVLSVPRVAVLGHGVDGVPRVGHGDRGPGAIIEPDRFSADEGVAGDELPGTAERLFGSIHARRSVDLR